MTLSPREERQEYGGRRPVVLDAAPRANSPPLPSVPIPTSEDGDLRPVVQPAAPRADSPPPPLIPIPTPPPAPTSPPHNYWVTEDSEEVNHHKFYVVIRGRCCGIFVDWYAPRFVVCPISPHHVTNFVQGIREPACERFRDSEGYQHLLQG